MPKRLFVRTVEITGEIELEIKARTKKEATLIAEKFIGDLCIDPLCFKQKEIVDVSEAINGDVVESYEL